jgi:hypothetical protein
MLHSYASVSGTPMKLMRTNKMELLRVVLVVIFLASSNSKQVMLYIVSMTKL